MNRSILSVLVVLAVIPRPARADEAAPVAEQDERRWHSAAEVSARGTYFSLFAMSQPTAFLGAGADLAVCRERATAAICFTGGGAQAVDASGVVMNEAHGMFRVEGIAHALRVGGTLGPGIVHVSRVTMTSGSIYSVVHRLGMHATYDVGPIHLGLQGSLDLVVPEAQKTAFEAAALVGFRFELRPTSR